MLTLAIMEERRFTGGSCAEDDVRPATLLHVVAKHQSLFFLDYSTAGVEDAHTRDTESRARKITI
jgi:hypothetical protein